MALSHRPGEGPLLPGLTLMFEIAFVCSVPGIWPTMGAQQMFEQMLRFGPLRQPLPHTLCSAPSAWIHAV